MPKDIFKIALTEPVNCLQEDFFFHLKKGASHLIDTSVRERNQKQHLRDLHSNKVEINGKMFNQGVAVGNADDTLKEQLNKAFGVRPELYPLHQGVIADAMAFITQNYTLSNRKSSALHVSPQNTHCYFKRRGDVYSLNAFLMSFCFRDGPDAIIIQTFQGLKEISSEYFWATINPNGQNKESFDTSMEKLGALPICQVQITAKIDCTEPHRIKASYALEIISDCLELFYKGPLKSNDVLLHIESLSEEGFVVISQDLQNEVEKKIDSSDSEEETIDSDDDKANAILLADFNELCAMFHQVPNAPTTPPIEQDILLGASFCKQFEASKEIENLNTIEQQHPKKAASLMPSSTQ